MKTTLIKLQDKFIVVSDELIKKGDWYFDKILGIVKSEFNALSPLPKIIASNIELKIPRKADESKLFHEITNTLPSIEFSQLSEKDSKTIGFVDVEKLAKDFANNSATTNYEEGINVGKYQGVIKGFQLAQSLNDKMFSLEDIELYTQWCSDKGYSYDASFGWKHPNGHRPNNSQLIRKYVKSLQQTEWNVEINKEYFYMTSKEFYKDADWVKWVKCDKSQYDLIKSEIPTCPLKIEPKITNNSIKIIKLL